MERRAIAVQGRVQGVGFRPYVYGLAARLQLGGVVSNEVGGVRIEVEGETGQVEAFLAGLVEKPPPLARIEGVSWERQAVRGERGFRIGTSTAGGSGEVVVGADAGTCADCLRELFDPGDRRYRYPFLNCTNCGPRMTIVTGAPYDRGRTTMAGFGLCAACREEYEDPGNRRFHAQPTACAACGPRAEARDGDGRAVEVGDVVRWFAGQVRGGAIGAMKGMGGYHLVCDARNGEAVAELRRRKGREEKAFAVMVGDAESAAGLCEMSGAERGLLEGVRRPIVLLKKRAGTGLEGCGPGNPRLGVMLPYTPLHYLLMGELGSGAVVVMTSGNRRDEPIATGEPEVFERLRGIADVYLTHNRPIHVRCDDSVVRVVGGRESLLRRSRGYAPERVRLPVRGGEPVLAVGGQMKGTFALAAAGSERAVVGHHLGDLDHYEAYRAFERDVGLYERLFGVRPAVIAHDLHPDYASTRYATGRAAAEGLRLVGVQHHHAHVAACMAENRVTERVIGVSFDGTGYGTDGAVWGGEFLVADLKGFERAGHLRYVAMPGGERAVKEPWRMGVAHLLDAEVEELEELFAGRVEAGAVRVARQMAERGFNAPRTSSMGRLFDAVAALLGVRERVSFEGQAAMELEWLAEAAEAEEGYAVEMEGGVIDTRGVIRGVMADVRRGVDKRRIARRFHRTVAGMVEEMCQRVRAATGIGRVALSGGVFMNGLLSEEVKRLLEGRGFVVLTHRLVPTNDGGICLGQLAVAAARNGESVCA